MKSVTRAILGRNVPAQFVGLSLADAEILEQVLLVYDGSAVDISLKHCIVCQHPLQIAVYAGKGLVAGYRDARSVNIVRKGKVVSATGVRLEHEFDIGAGFVLIFSAVSSACFQLNPATQRLLLKRFRNKDQHSMEDLNLQAALYSYPRYIQVISFRDDSYFNLFPMNFIRWLPSEGLYLFGLRTTNITLGKILMSGRVVVADTGDADLQTIYSLGNHHSNLPPGMGSLPFKVKESEQYRFPVPEFSRSYLEIEIFFSRILGSHVFFAGRSITRPVAEKPAKMLYNVHLFEYLATDYVQVG